MTFNSNVRTWLAAAVGLLILVAPLPASAVNKCTAKDGAVKYQDAPCENWHADAKPVKTWTNSTDSSGTSANKLVDVEPNESLKGVPQAAGLVKIYRRWIDAERLGMATSRIALAGPVASLQALQREVEAIDVAPCMADAKAALVGLVTKSTHAFLSFMSDRSGAGAALYQLRDRPALIPQFEKAAVTPCN